MKSEIKSSRSYEMDMCNGPLFGKILIYALPLMISGVLQLTFNAVDLIVVGRFAGSGPLASVGSTSSLINLMLNLFIGLSVGANVLVAHYYGAGKIERIKKIAFICLGVVIAIGLVLGGTVTFFGDTLLRLYGTNDEETAYGLICLHYICRVYFLCGIMDVFVGLMRGMGYAFTPMIVSLTGACLLRIVWIMTVFQFFGTLDSLYLSYAVTWIVTASVHCVCFIHAYKKKRAMFAGGTTEGV
ncbi:MAG: hypothetical protein LUC95_10140 [Lachnospiraceae bacterium]|nr:hypothetical protein [Lachnospiraceae bacterium]